jgi:hypothetical protein
MTNIKCQHCGADVEIPPEIDEASRKWLARNEKEKQAIKEKHEKDPGNGKPRTITIKDGGLRYNGELIVRADDIQITVYKSGVWQGWANIGYRSLLMAGPTNQAKLRNPVPEGYMIELGDDGPRSKITPTRLYEGPGPRNFRFIFVGNGSLNMPSGHAK